MTGVPDKQLLIQFRHLLCEGFDAVLERLQNHQFAQELQSI
jgi:hypothetical protein